MSFKLILFIRLLVYHPPLPIPCDISSVRAPQTMTFTMFLDRVGRVFTTFSLRASREVVLRCHLGRKTHFLGVPLTWRQAGAGCRVQTLVPPRVLSLSLGLLWHGGLFLGKQSMRKSHVPCDLGLEVTHSHFQLFSCSHDSAWRETTEGMNATRQGSLWVIVDVGYLPGVLNPRSMDRYPSVAC